MNANMTKQLAASETGPDTVRAGVISALIVGVCYLYVTGFSSLPRVWAFMVLVAVCFVLMMKSLVDLVVWVVSLTARLLGIGLGRTIRFARRLGAKVGA